MISIKLKEDETGYDVVSEYIMRYWEHGGENEIPCIDGVIVHLGKSYDGKHYDESNEIVFPAFNFDNCEYLYDWWEGQEFIKIFGIKYISELEISGGIYTE